MSVAGPLVVLSEALAAPEETNGLWVEPRRVYVYDVGQDRYWAAFDYRHSLTDYHYSRSGRFDGSYLAAVQMAGTSLIVRSEDQVRRVSLNGDVEAILFEHEGIEAIKVSPDGTKVAIILYGYILLVIDTHTGEEILRSYPDQEGFSIGHWSKEGDMISINNNSYPSRSTILTLDGDIRTLPEDWIISPDLKSALRYGMKIGIKDHVWVYENFDIIDIESGEIMLTYSEEEGVRQSWKYLPVWMGESRYVSFSLPSAGDTWLLDATTGEMLLLTPDISRNLEGRVRSTCLTTGDYRSYPCDVRYDGRVLWEGARGWTHYLGTIEAVDNLSLRGITLIDVVRELSPPPPPDRSEIIGPIFLYEISDEHEYLLDGTGGFISRPTRHLIARDEDTGRTWSLFTGAEEVQVAKNGLVIEYDQDLFYLSLDGYVRRLTENWHADFIVSPDGEKVAIHFYNSSSDPAHTIILDTLSGEQILRIDSDDIPSITGLDHSRHWLIFPHELSWILDSENLLVLIGDEESWAHDELIFHALITLDGDAYLNLCDDGGGVIVSCVSPDARYIVRGREDESAEYRPWNWWYIDIIDLETERVLWSLETEAPLQERNWEWASDTQFAWSSGTGWFNFDRKYPDWEATSAEVSVIDVTTGEIEVMDSADYLARFHPPPRATTDCPPNPAHSCRILLDGEVVGEGRWPIIVGFIALDQQPPPAP